MDYRVEHDTMGEVRVPAGRLWGAQTQRSLQNFPIGEETMPREIIRAFACLKKACALANYDAGRLDGEKRDAITAACDRCATCCSGLSGWPPLVQRPIPNGWASRCPPPPVVAI